MKLPAVVLLCLLISACTDKRVPAEAATAPVTPHPSPTETRCAPERHAELPVIFDLTYHEARRKLLSAGWQPFQTIHHNDAGTNINTSHGNGQIFWEKGYWEIEACAGTGLGPCSFLFTDAYSNRLRVTTAGEEDRRQHSVAGVTSYKLVCRELD
jgi:hypothetical protein